MGKVIVDLSMSLDGFIAGVGVGRTSPLGEGGMALFAWMGAGPEANRVESRLCPPDASVPVVQEWVDDVGALLVGRRTFDIVGGWRTATPSTRRLLRHP